MDNVHPRPVERDAKLLFDIEAEQRRERECIGTVLVVEYRETVDFVRDEVKVVVLGELAVREQRLARI